MNVRLTGDPAKAARIRPVEKTRGANRTAGDVLFRAMLRAGDLDETARSFQAIVATATPVLRRDSRGPFLEVLDPAGVENDPEDDAPVLTDHRANARETVGRATGFTVDAFSVSATLRLGLADDVEPIFQRVKDGTLRHVSAGYRVTEWREGRDDKGQRTKTATRWRILEVSIVPIPADPGAIIHQRSDSMPFDLETRTALIDSLRSACALPDEWGADLDVETITNDMVRESAREAMLTRQAPRIRVTRDHGNPAEIQTRAADALAFRMVGGDLPEASREFVGMSLRELAADALQRSGVSTRGLTADDVFSRSLGQLTTSDFPLLVSNAMGKVAAQAYRAAESPLKALARQRTLPNFKTSTAIRLGEMGRLEEMTESGEFTHTSRAESGETMTLKTFGRAINISRKLLIDDDLGLLGDMTSAMGQAAAQTEADEMVKLLTANPALSDGKTVFHADHGNTAAVALSEVALTAARQHMRTVKGLDGKTIVAVKPRYLVVGPELETQAEKLLAAIYPATTADANAFAGKLNLVVEPRITDDSWFVLADPASVPSIQYAYLSAAQGVQIQRQESWDTLGLRYRAWLDFGCGWLDWRGAYRSTGV